MSWIKKAEELLNRVDQSAAQALSKSENDESGEVRRKRTASNASSENAHLDTSSGTSTPSRRREVRGFRKADLLSDYSNGLETRRGELDKYEARLSSYSSASLGGSTWLKSDSGSESDVSASRSRRAMQTIDSATGSASADGDDSEAHRPPSDSMLDSEQTQTSSDLEQREQTAVEGAQGHLSTLELENKLLKREVDSLNRECASLIERSRAAQSELLKTQRRLRELESALADAHEALRAKDSQIGVLRVRLDETEQNAGEARQLAHAAEVKDGAIDTLAAQLRELDTTLRNERSAHELALRQAAEATSRVEAEREALAAQLNEASRRVSDERFRAAELSRQLLLAKHASDELRDELSAHREKAQLLVSAKERTIAQLAATLQRNGVSEVSLTALSVANANDDLVSVKEFDAVRNERDSLRDELRTARCTVEQLRADLQDAEVQADSERRSLQDTASSLEQQLNVARARVADFENELRNAQRSSQCAQDEFQKQTTHLRSRLSDREAEIERLRSQVLALQRATHMDSLDSCGPSVDVADSSDMATRVRSLTENLIAKQTLVETLQTEKQTLRMQYERLNDRFSELQRFANTHANGKAHSNVQMFDEQSSSGSVATLDYDDVVRRRLPLPAFVRESLSRDSNLTRNMRKAFTSLDVFSIRLGLFLRRYPIARFFLLCYVLVLHLWVFVVLTTYQHEIHTSADLLYAPHAVDFVQMPQAAHADGRQPLPAANPALPH